jgi:uncharacterized membrane protein
MTWLTRYRVRRYLRDSIWIMPVLGAIAAIVLVRIIDGFERYEGWRSLLRPETAQSVLATMASSLFTFVVFVGSVMLIAVQLASSLLSPRIIGIIFRDLITRSALTLFVFCFSFSIAALSRIGESVPTITTRLAAYSGIASLAAFLFLIDHAGRLLRPSGVLSVVGATGRREIARVYPRRLNDRSVLAPSASTEATAAKAVSASPRIVSSERDGVVLAFDVAGLVAAAKGAGCIVELVPQVGDFIVDGDPLFKIHHDSAGAAGEASLSDALFRHSIAVGQERTTEQDPAFAFRIIVDIASKGLSAAINDPTTAVLAIDQIHHLLRDVGCRDLDDERVRDDGGAVRLIYRTPGWDDFVQLAVTEVRQFGAGSIQVARRLRAMLENLVQVLPPQRVPSLQRELDILARATSRLFADAEDRALAQVPDLQGVGAMRSQKGA